MTETTLPTPILKWLRKNAKHDAILTVRLVRPAGFRVALESCNNVFRMQLSDCDSVSRSAQEAISVVAEWCEKENQK